MISSSRVTPSILGHLLAQHRDLHSRMLMLRTAFAAKTPPGRGGLDAIRGRLRALREHLATHFDQEERGGFLEEAIARMPRLAAPARDVVRQHPALLAELDALLERLQMRDIHSAAWGEAARGFASFADHLLAHERNENAVVQQGYNEDFGFPE